MVVCTDEVVVADNTELLLLELEATVALDDEEVVALVVDVAAEAVADDDGDAWTAATGATDDTAGTTLEDAAAEGMSLAPRMLELFTAAPTAFFM